MNKKLVLLAALAIIIFALGCLSRNAPQTVGEPNDVVAKRACINLCKEKVNESRNLSSGPCLFEDNRVVDWVCDVAHNPREAVDNLPENQCSAYREGRAQHFVEVDEKCNLIQAV